MQDLLRKWFDWPPAWAALGLLVIWALAWIPVPYGFGRVGPGLALSCLVIGLWLMSKALLRMRARGTTVNPRGQPTALVTDSVFAISRNPIYLGDTLILAAAACYWNSLLGLGVTAAFVWVINSRFIPVEEARLVEVFGTEATDWFAKVRRWI